ncbi:response regulator transcription factor [Paenibacillus arenilitoris]|uniref:Response regulator n=1 Tax=Paenibacillus arenilitoris TaxID=2772299 RepID=A0A927CKC5_9BACL|nr:response regulator [Paenibacillus arenilitoris]MBD2869139.1 response regulator [Paenibacillus arenilitoris]
MKICSVMIVDDEITIRRGLTKLIERNAPNWSVVGEARNGLEAIGQLQALRPDLVMTDVRMPHMDGIGIAKHIYDRSPDTKVVILTGYKDLEYAQAAIRYGVLDFLLKPCPEQELLKVLDKACQLIMKDLKNREVHLLEQQLIEEHAIRSQMLRLPYDPGKLEDIEGKYVQKELLLLKVTTYFPDTKTYKKSDLHLLQFALTNVVEELMEAFKLAGTLLPVVHNVYAVFLDAHSSIPDFVRSLKEALDQVLGLPIVIHPAGPIRNVAQLPACFEEIASEQIRADAMPETGLELQTVNQNKIRAVQDEIMSKIMLGQSDLVKSYVADYIAGLKAMSVEAAKLEALTLVLSLFVIIQKEFSADRSALDIGDPIGELRSMDDLGDVLNWTRKQEELFYKEFGSWLQNKNENIIAKAIRYIENHYMEDCSLTEVAGVVHLSHNYFSNMFKKEKGESFVNYVTSVRMDKAKILLCNTTMKISEIAESVGYDDPNYFTTVFKQFVKQSPREYRKQSNHKG